MSTQKVLVTGVYGLIAGAVYNHFRELPEKYDVYALARRRQPSVRVAEGRELEVPEERFFPGDLSDFGAVRRAVEGMDVVVQMAATPGPDDNFDHILQGNLIGAYNVFEACRQAGVGRIVYASSVMASWGYHLDEPYKAIWEGRFEDVPEPIPIVTHRHPVRPTETYSASKVWGEALARSYSDVHGLSCICLRIGWVNAQDRPIRRQGAGSIWCSQRDIVQLVERCVDAPENVRFDIFYGASDNRYRWVDIAHAREVVGYVPQDSAEAFYR